MEMTTNHRATFARKQSGLSVGQAAKLLDLHVDILREHEENILDIPEETLYQMSVLYAVKYEWISCVVPLISENVAERMVDLKIKDDDDHQRVAILLSSLR